MLLTHYHHKNDPPFQNLSSLTEAEALTIVSKLQGRTGTVYSRFRDPQKYLRQRRETENWVRQKFSQKGGQPISNYPHYFVVGKAAWIEEGYNGQSGVVQLPVSAFDPKHISFTYPDSMISYWLKSQGDRVFYRPEYHGQVFLLSEISKIIELFGIPSEEWKTQDTRKYDLFIEAQVWTSIPEMSLHLNRSLY